MKIIKLKNILKEIQLLKEFPDSILLYKDDPYKRKRIYMNESGSKYILFVYYDNQKKDDQWIAYDNTTYNFLCENKDLEKTLNTIERYVNMRPALDDITHRNIIEILNAVIIKPDPNSKRFITVTEGDLDRDKITTDCRVAIDHDNKYYFSFWEKNNINKTVFDRFLESQKIDKDNIIFENWKNDSEEDSERPDYYQTYDEFFETSNSSDVDQSESIKKINDKINTIMKKLHMITDPRLKKELFNYKNELEKELAKLK